MQFNKNTSSGKTNIISLIIKSDEKQGTIRLDLTNVVSSTNPDGLNSSDRNYEAELEYVPGKSKPSDSILNEINNHIILIIQLASIFKIIPYFYCI